MGEGRERLGKGVGSGRDAVDIVVWWVVRVGMVFMRSLLVTCGLTVVYSWLVRVCSWFTRVYSWFTRLFVVCSWFTGGSLSVISWLTFDLLLVDFS